MPVPVVGVREVGVLVFQRLVAVRMLVGSWRAAFMTVRVVAVSMDVAVVVLQRFMPVGVPVPFQSQQQESAQHKRAGPKQPCGKRLAQENYAQRGAHKGIRTEEGAGPRGSQSAHGQDEKHQTYTVTGKTKQ